MRTHGWCAVNRAGEATLSASGEEVGVEHMNDGYPWTYGFMELDEVLAGPTFRGRLTMEFEEGVELSVIALISHNLASVTETMSVYSPFVTVSVEGSDDGSAWSTIKAATTFAGGVDLALCFPATTNTFFRLTFVASQIEFFVAVGHLFAGSLRLLDRATPYGGLVRKERYIAPTYESQAGEKCARVRAGPLEELELSFEDVREAYQPPSIPPLELELDAGTRFHFKCEEPNGTLYDEVATYARPETGNTSRSYGVTPGVLGPNGYIGTYARYFQTHGDTGQGGENKSTTLPAAVLTSLGDFALGFWLLVGSYPTTVDAQALILKGYYNQFNLSAYTRPGDTLRIGLNWGGTNTNLDSSPTAGVWYWYTLVKRGTTLELYRNGALLNSGAASASSVGAGDNVTLQLGGSTGGGLVGLEGRFSRLFLQAGTWTATDVGEAYVRFVGEAVPDAIKEEDAIFELWKAGLGGTQPLLFVHQPELVATAANDAHAQECLFCTVSESMTWRQTDYAHWGPSGIVLTQVPRGDGL